MTVDGGSMNEQSVTDLNNGGTYTISIVATAGTSLPSESVNADMMVSLGKVQCTCISTLDHDRVYSCMLFSSQFQPGPVSTLIHQQQPPPSPCPGVLLTLW